MHLFSEIFEHSSVGLCVLNDRLEVVRCNRQFEYIFGQTSSEQSIEAIIAAIKLNRIENVIKKNRPYRLSINSNVNEISNHLNITFKLLPGSTELDARIICECLIDNSKSELDAVILSFEQMMENYKSQINDQKELLVEADRDKMALVYSMNLELEEKVKQRTQELSRAKKELAHQANHDVLTGLANRRLFNDKIEHALITANFSMSELAVLYLDLDKFKQINDSLGHHVGDVLLVTVAERLNTIVRTHDLIARMGGDEFAIIIQNANSTAVAKIATKINQALAVPFNIETHTLNISTSIGICMFSEISRLTSAQPKGTDNSINITQAADVAMYEVKTTGRNHFTFFDHKMLSKVASRVTLEGSLRTAIASEQLVLHYQPKINLSNGEISGCEALVRWQHPQQGLLYPDAFIPMAEETGLVTELGLWVMKQAFAQLKQWRKDGVAIPSIAINLSGKQLESKTHQNDILKLLAVSELPPDCIEFELTESVLMGHKSSSGLQFLELLGNSGYGVSMDDFGTGYSSLSYLRYLPVKTLKIDRSFIANLHQNQQEDALVLTIIAIAKTMGLKIVAEGIETKEHLEFLTQHHCDEGQGYYLSRPITASQIEQFAARSHLLTTE